MTDEDYGLVQKDYKILVMTQTFPGYYGKADTIAQARKNCLGESGNSREYKDKMIAWLVHKDTTITGLGGFQYPNKAPEPIRLGKV